MGDFGAPLTGQEMSECMFGVACKGVQHNSQSILVERKRGDRKWALINVRIECTCLKTMDRKEMLQTTGYNYGSFHFRVLKFESKLGNNYYLNQGDSIGVVGLRFGKVVLHARLGPLLNS